MHTNDLRDKALQGGTTNGLDALPASIQVRIIQPNHFARPRLF